MPEAVLDLLARRAELLDRIAERPADKPALGDALGVSRSTVDRAVRELAERGFIERCGDGYRTTAAGRLAAASYGEFRRRSEGIRAAADVLDVLPPDAPLDARALAGAEVVAADGGDPERPARRIAELVGRADEVRGAGGLVADRYVRLYRDRILDGTAVRVVLAPASLERLLAGHADAVAAALETGLVELRESPDAPPFGLRLYSRDDETTMSVTVYDDDLRGIICNDDPGAVEWAAEYVERIWNDARAIPTP